MAKYYGNIGFSEVVETAPGVHQHQNVEQFYRGDFLYNSRQYEDSQNLNQGVLFNSRVSILADDFALSNAASIQYVTWLGTKWSVRSFEIERPRITLRLGGVYNG